VLLARADGGAESPAALVEVDQGDGVGSRKMAHCSLSDRLEKPGAMVGQVPCTEGIPRANISSKLEVCPLG
jgi:hypothetical protein